MEDSPFGLFRKECVALITDALRQEGLLEKEIRLTVPSDSAYGDLSFSTFALGKSAGNDPRLIAEGAVKRIEAFHRELVGKVESAGGGYVNFFIDLTRFAELTLGVIGEKGRSYGLSTTKRGSVIVEHTSVNPIHPIHVGGARNAVIGDCLSRILRAAGKEVKTHFYIDDVGLQVAQASYGLGMAGSARAKEKSDHFIGFIYAVTSCAMSIKRLRMEIEELKVGCKDEEARGKIGELDDWIGAAADLRSKDEELFDRISDSICAVQDPDSEVNKLLKRYEEKDSGAVKLIRGLSELALAGFRETLDGVGIGFDSWDWESEITSWSGSAEKVVDRLAKTEYVEVEKGTYVLDSELVATKLKLKEKYGIRTEVPPLTLKRSDGTTLYTTRDIAYTLWKFERAEEIINVISIEQKLPQLQLKLALYALGEGKLADRLVHFSYELVHLPGYKMSGRRGRFIAFDDVLSEGVDRAFREVTERSPHLSEEERRRIAEVVGIGSVRYAMIAVASNKPITFTWDRVLNFEQNSAPFIQYAHARASNILAKAGSDPAKCGPPDYSGVQSNYEKDLIVMLSIFPEVVSDAARTLKPEMLAEFANNLASKFNLFYDNIPVLKAEGGIKAARLNLVEATKLVIANALSLIGIEAPSRM